MDVGIAEVSGTADRTRIAANTERDGSQAARQTQGAPSYPRVTVASDYHGHNLFLQSTTTVAPTIAGVKYRF